MKLPVRLGGGRKRKADDKSSSAAQEVIVRQPGRKPGSGSGPSREDQKKGTVAAAVARAVGSEGENVDTQMDGSAAPTVDTDHVIKTRIQQERWRDLMPRLRGLFCDAFPGNLARAKAAAVGRRVSLQAELDSSSCQHACEGCREGDITKLPDGELLYYGMDCIFSLTMHKWQCKCCNTSFSPDALHYGCFASTPVTAHIWYDLRVFDLYRKFGLKDGLSATGQAIILHN